MPCIGPTETEMDAWKLSQDPLYRTPAQKRQDKYDNLKKYSDETTQFLCFMIAEARLAGTFNDLPMAVTKWSARHDEIDRKRVIKKVKRMVKSQPSKHPVDIALDLTRKALKVHPVSEYHEKWFYEIAKEVYDDYWEDADEKLENI